jgi:hypothetical protein
MKKKSAKSAFFNPRVLIGFIFCVAGVFLALLGAGAFSKASAQAPNQNTAGSQPDRPQPDVVRMVGPVALNQDLRSLPYIAPKEEFEERVLTRYPHGTGQTGAPAAYGTSGLAYVQQLLKNVLRPAPTMPPPLLTFEALSAAQACACAPPDTDGDVGPNHYVEAVNVAFKVFDKSGNTLAGPTTYNSLFAPLTGTPCGSGQNDGDPFALYDPVADRWLISDFAFPSFPGSSFWQCIAVSQTPDPVSGGWFLYALQVDPSNPTFLGDYPKFALWNNPQPGGAYFLTVNLFNPNFQGVRVFALDRGSMLGGGPANAISFMIPIAGLGDSYSLVAATFRTGTAPLAGEDEFLLDVDSPASNPTTLTQVKGWRFHVDFVIPANSTLGIGTNHSPNALITVSPFVEAWTNTGGFSLVPQQGTADKIQTLGDKIMTPVVYQNRAGTESLWADQTNILNFPSGPTIIRWYQFDVTGGTFPATAAQQQDWSNANDGLWRFMPSIAVDQNGNTAIGYSMSSPSMFPGIRYAGRLATDPPNDLSQGEAIMFSGTGSQTDTSNRWGDYSMTTVDPADGASFWHVNEYYATTSSFNWHTRIGKFRFGPAAQSAFSRKVHGGAGTFDVPLPLTGNVGVECRSGGATNDYQMIINFATSVTVESVAVTSGSGSVSSFSVSGSQVTVNLTGVTNVQTITVTLHNVNDGTSTGDVPVSIGVLVGDVNGNAAVNASDVALTKSQVGAAVSGSNFREDVNANGVINSVDVAQVKAEVGTALPP